MHVSHVQVSRRINCLRHASLNNANHSPWIIKEVKVLLKYAVVAIVKGRDGKVPSKEETAMFRTALLIANPKITRGTNSVTCKLAKVKRAITEPVEAYFAQLQPGAEPQTQEIFDFILPRLKKPFH